MTIDLRRSHIVSSSVVWRERKVLNVIVFSMITFMVLQIGSMFRLFGVVGVAEFLLLSYRLLDLLVVVSFFFYCGTRLFLRWEDILLLLMFLYPAFVGIVMGNLNITYLNEIAIFFLFLLKIIVVRTLLLRLARHVWLDDIIGLFVARIYRRSVLIAALLLGIALVALALGVVFYYQAPAEITFAAALAAAQGHWASYLLVLVLATLGGKRGILMGVLAIGIFAAILPSNRKRSVYWILALLLALIPGILFFGDGDLFSDGAISRKLTGTVRTVQEAFSESATWDQFFLLLDSGRYVEWVSVAPHLEGASLWFGNGYGFRYELNSAFLREVGRNETSQDVSGAHFTPLAIVVKFGILGLVIWVLQLILVFGHPRDNRSFFQFACKLGFISIVVQSIFSFGYFINFFTPIFIAGANVGWLKVASQSKVPPVNFGARR